MRANTLIWLTSAALFGACAGAGGVVEGETDGGGSLKGDGTDGTDPGTDGTDTDGTDTDGTDTGGTDSTDVAPPAGVPVLGNGQNSIDYVMVKAIADADAGLATPRDLEINPDRPNELWIVNRTTESVVVVTDPGTESATARYFWSFGSAHFMAQPSALAFGAPDQMATIHETDEYTQGPPPLGTPKDFMGPTLQYTGDLDIFDAGHGSHLDMLHNSPLGMGIAWERDTIYWVFDGYHSSITRYDFNEPHELAGTDHSDAIVSRCVEGEVTRLPDVPSHMAFDHETNLLYIADTGNSRIAVLDTTTGTKGSPIGPNYDGGDQHGIDDAELWTLVDGETSGLQAPSGLELHGDLLFVGDNATGRIHAFDLEGNEVDWMDTSLEPGALMGIALDAEGRLYFTDALNDRVYRASPLE